MIKNILFFGILFLPTIVYSQSNYDLIDKNSIHASDSLKKHSEIANYLIQNLQTEKEKARALYIWIAHNIEYDLELMDSLDSPNVKARTIEETLNKKKGVCQNYAELYLAMSNDVGLESYLISGYTKNYRNEIADDSHAWNAIKIDSSFYLLDITWAAGFVRNDIYVHEFRDEYFLVTPSEFIKTHMPFDPVWQFINNPINNNDFISNDFSKLEQPGDFMFSDSISTLETIDELTALQRSVARIINLDPKNNLDDNQTALQESNIRAMKFNLGVELANSGFKQYNIYIELRNKRFRKLKLSDSELRNLFEGAESNIIRANEIFTDIITKHEKPSNNLLNTKKYLSDFLPNIYHEKKILNRYLKTWKPIRFLMI
ncbi:MAG: hypothetical protein ACI9RM_002816 [Ulvibacter sp.]|jgi:hypothetical protein